jgi:hypothetical protein
MERSIGTTYIPVLQRSDLGSIQVLGGNVYMTEGSRSFVDALTDGNVIGFVYSGSNKIYVDSILVSTNSPTARAELYVSATGITGSVANLIKDIPINLRLGGPSANVTSSTSEGIGPVTGSVTAVNKLFTIHLSTSIPTWEYKFNGSLVLSQYDTFLIRGQVGVAADYLRTSILYHELESGI